MSDSSSLPTGPDASPARQRLTERVLARIKDAHRDLQSKATRGGKGRARRTTDSDTRALRRVFLELGDSYRSYRRRTGEPVAADVRDAALRFRRDLDLSSLVSVAASLDRLDRDMVG
ncbi:MAG TPA: hypothetical protein VFR62_03050 [Gemmatimonadales bacterium]|nr:hypothetical protein [Gemmatimonadales bacterium]